jgi:hypothetical protein
VRRADEMVDPQHLGARQALWILDALRSAGTSRR